MNHPNFAATVLVILSTCYQVDGTAVPFSKRFKLAQDFSMLLKIFEETSVVEVNGSYYFLSNKKKSWSAAEHDCKHLGGHLSSIHSVAENNFLFAQIKTRYGTGDCVWIGLNDLYHDGTYSWIDKTTRDYLNWQSGQPAESTITNCGYIYSSDGKWYTNTYCTSLFHYICKL